MQTYLTSLIYFQIPDSKLFHKSFNDVCYNVIDLARLQAFNICEFINYQQLKSTDFSTFKNNVLHYRFVKTLEHLYEQYHNINHFSYVFNQSPNYISAKHLNSVITSFTKPVNTLNFSADKSNTALFTCMYHANQLEHIPFTFAEYFIVKDDIIKYILKQLNYTQQQIHAASKIHTFYLPEQKITTGFVILETYI